MDKPPLQLGGMWLPWSTDSGDLMCMPWPYVNHKCLSRGRGLLPWEYNHMRSQHAESHPDYATIHAVHDDHAEHAEDPSAEETHFKLAHHIVQIDAATELETLQPLKDDTMLFLDNLVHVVFPEDMSKQREAYNQFWQECAVLDTAAYTAMFDLDGNRGKRHSKPMADLGLSHQPAHVKRGRLHRRSPNMIKT